MRYPGSGIASIIVNDILYMFGGLNNVSQAPYINYKLDTWQRLDLLSFYM